MDDNFLINSQSFWIGQRLVILPVGVEPPLGCNKIPIWIESDGVFGTGGHSTTKLCLKVLERHLSKDAIVIDVGTGTGILAIAAIKLGAHGAIAVDLEPKAIEAAKHNFLLNRVDQQIRIQQGSIGAAFEEIRKLKPPSLVIVNILASAIEQLFSEGLAGLIPSGSVLVLSGILAAQTPGIRACLQIYGFDLIAQEHEEAWVCILAKRR